MIKFIKNFVFFFFKKKKNNYRLIDSLDENFMDTVVELHSVGGLSKEDLDRLYAQLLNLELSEKRKLHLK